LGGNVYRLDLTTQFCQARIKIIVKGKIMPELSEIPNGGEEYRPRMTRQRAGRIISETLSEEGFNPDRIIDGRSARSKEMMDSFDTNYDGATTPENNPDENPGDAEFDDIDKVQSPN
jgi:hypothetical protein